MPFARPGHITFGSDWPFAPLAASNLFAPLAASNLFAARLEDYSELDDDARTTIECTNALRLFPRFGTAAPPAPLRRADHFRHVASRTAMRGITKLINATT